MNIFQFRNKLIEDYKSYVESFIRIKDKRIKSFVDSEIKKGTLWPNPLIQLNPAFEPGGFIEGLVEEEVLHFECAKIFRRAKGPGNPEGLPLRLHRHQEEAVRLARKQRNYVLTTGTGSGKSLAYIIPVVDYILRHGSGKGIKAIVVYPMNALANSQFGELEKFLCEGYPEGQPPVRFDRYTGQEKQEKRREIIENPPDILLTNYVMLELILTRPEEHGLIEAAKGLQFLVLDELHTYRGRQGADVALLNRRVRNLLGAPRMQCVGTSATLAGPGTHREQQEEVARLATRVFGTDFEPDDIVGETLRRITPDLDFADPEVLKQLKHRIESNQSPSNEFEAFVNDPMASWIETHFGLTKEVGSGKLKRAAPKSIEDNSDTKGAGSQLAEQIGFDQKKCEELILSTLLKGYHVVHPETNFPVFAFRLHQFISRGDCVYASLEKEGDRFLTLNKQQFVPNSEREKILLPLVFNREGGQEYFCVRRRKDPSTGDYIFEARELDDKREQEHSDPGFLYLSSSNPWPERGSIEELERVPEDWLEEFKGSHRIRRDRRKNMPDPVRIDVSGRSSPAGLAFVFVPAPFRFCLDCGISYGFQTRSDFGKLSTLGSEGRSTATTILTLHAILDLQDDGDLDKEAKKLLSFTDNRQDASLQAGHFNDFIEVSMLRGAIVRAAKACGENGIQHHELTQRIFENLALPREAYALEPEAKFMAAKETDQALRDVLGYRVYQDLRRGWRVTAPNLEQCGLLEIEYASLDELCASEEDWESVHPALVSATPDERIHVCKVLLDYMRRSLAINVDYLDDVYQQQVRQKSSQRLRAPWSVDEKERMEHAAIAFPRSRAQHDTKENIFISALSGYGRFLRTTNRFSQYSEVLKRDDTAEIIEQVLDRLRIAGIVTVAHEPKDGEGVKGYQVLAGALIWKARDGSKSYVDPIAVPNPPKEDSTPNRYFVDFYQNHAALLHKLEAREHTAQVPPAQRQIREDMFKEAELPILFCSPTMELGIDIKQLNVVNLRNIPPTPANYAQRSGRAGRSGQPALVFSYCTLGSPHDQYFFRNPQDMVSGAVSTPRLELTNEDLLRAHLHSVWLTQSKTELGSSLSGILNLEGSPPALTIQPELWEQIINKTKLIEARRHAELLLEGLENELEQCDWFDDLWLEEVFNNLPSDFEKACERWKTMYRSASQQAERQHRIIHDVTRSAEEKKQARRLREDAESQLRLLVNESKSQGAQSDFYTYRYFASEGFLPGYNFPRLPLSAFIPGHRAKNKENDFLSRSRFLAITEFGPRSIIYHEGSRYRINRVILPVRSDESDDITTGSVKICEQCGYMHPIYDGPGPDVCESCSAELPKAFDRMFRLQNVVTKRADRINSDEEERFRLGFDVKTVIRYSERGGRTLKKRASINVAGSEIGSLIYGQTATVWRINFGWKRRGNQDQYGYLLDTERGYWKTNDDEESDDEEDPMSKRVARVIPYVEDRRNCLIVDFNDTLEEGQMASFEAAFKKAIQVVYQLEDQELSTECLPTRADRKRIMLYEASEGGAGVLRLLVEDPEAMARVGKKMLEICHFDSKSFEDKGHLAHNGEGCDTACYDCLLSYFNQPDHAILDRCSIKDILIGLANCTVEVGQAEVSRGSHLIELLEATEVSEGKKWLGFLEENNLKLPSHAQAPLANGEVIADFLYQDQHLAVFISDPDDKDAVTDTLFERGYTALFVGPEDNWPELSALHPSVFSTHS